MIKLIEEENTSEIILSINDKNTFTKEALLSINEVLLKWKANSDLLFAVISSNQPNFFSNGLDPQLFLDQDETVIRENVRLIIEVSYNFFSLPFITLCAINGHCAGAAALLAMYADFRYSVDAKARFGFPEVHIGMNFPSFAYQILESIVGRNHATSLLFKGELLKPGDALAIGLIHEALPADQLYKKIAFLKKQILQKSKESVRGLKSCMIRRYEFDMMRLKDQDIETTVQTVLTPKTQEGFKRLLHTI